MTHDLHIEPRDELALFQLALNHVAVGDRHAYCVDGGMDRQLEQIECQAATGFHPPIPAADNQ
jgi:hypothetical protein